MYTIHFVCVCVCVCVNTFWSPHLKMSSKRFTVTTIIAPLSASKQTHCMLVACIFEWVTVHSTFLLLTSIKVVKTLFGCYMAGAMSDCCRFSARYLYTIQPCTCLQCHFIWSHIHGVHLYWAVTCHLHFWQNDKCQKTMGTLPQVWAGDQNHRRWRQRELVVVYKLSTSDTLAFKNLMIPH